MWIPLGTASSLVLSSFALGAGLVYFLDRENGLKRRRLVREQLGRARESLKKLPPIAASTAEAEVRDSLF